GLTSTTQITVTIQGVNDTPTDITGVLTIAENSVNGTSAGTVSSVDLDSGDSFAYVLTDNAGGRFAINSSTGQITVANASLLNYEANTSHTIIVQVTDAAGATLSKTLTVTVSDVNEFSVGSISDANTSTNTVAENSSIGTAVGITASPAIYFTESFNGFSGGSSGTQYLTGDALKSSTSLTGWTSSGTNAFHVVQRAAGNQALMLFSDNVATSSNLTQINQSGRRYAIDLDIAPAVYAGGSQATTAADGIVVQVLRLDGTVLASNVFLPGAFQSGYSFMPVSLTFTGDGSGDVRVRLLSSTPASGRFAGAVDNLRVRAVALDEDGTNNNITYSLDSSSGGLFAINSSTGVVTIAGAIDYETATSHTISVRATSSDTSFSLQNFSIAVTNVNEGPVAVADTATAVEASGVSNGTTGTNPNGNVLTNDTDVDAGDTKAVVGVVAGTQASAAGNVAASVTGAYGSINIAGTGAYTYTVDNSNAAVQALSTTGNTLSDVFTYTMNDASGAASTTQITVTIQGANDAPWDSGFAPGSGLNFSGAGEVALSGLGVNTAAGATTTVEFWMNWNGTNNVMPFGFNNIDLFLYQGFFGFNTSNTDVYGISSSGLANGWRHIAAVFYNGDVTQNQLFVDGVQQTLGQRTGTPINTNAYVNSSAKISGWNTDGAYKFTGGIDEVRIWNGTRTQSQIQSNLYSSLSGPVSGLLASYNLDSVTFGAGGVVDVSGNNRNGTTSGLNSGNITTPTWSSTVVASVAENAANATVIGSVRGYDYDAGDTLTYSLANNAGGRFAVTSGGVLSVADGSLLNFEAATNHTIVLCTTDAAAWTFDKTLTINLTNVNETPTAVADTATAVEAGGVSNGTVGNNPTGNVLTNDTDVDAGDTKAVTGVAAGTVASASGSIGVAVNGSYGSITIANNGDYTYNVDNSNA
ncbi:MAG: beta strand repeat-containing protein, partial [Pirellula sp.]